MKLTVLGNNGPFPGPGGACSGHLFESRDSHIALDFGNLLVTEIGKTFDLKALAKS